MRFHLDFKYLQNSQLHQQSVVLKVAKTVSFFTDSVPNQVWKEENISALTSVTSHTEISVAIEMHPASNKCWALALSWDQFHTWNIRVHSQGKMDMCAVPSSRAPPAFHGEKKYCTAFQKPSVPHNWSHSEHRSGTVNFVQQHRLPMFWLFKQSLIV